MSSTVEILLRAKNETDAAFNALLKQLEGAKKQTHGWSEEQQRAAQSMARVHDEALKMNKALADQASAMDKAHSEALKMNKSYTALGQLSEAWPALATAALTAMAAVAVAVGKAIVDATLKAAAYGDTLAGLSDKTGLSTDALQSLEVAAQLGNSSLEAVTGAVNKMQKGLVDGASWVKKLGLNMQELRAMAPDEQFKAVAVAIESIVDPAERAAARMAVFGKSGNELAGTLKAAAAGAGELGGALSGEALAASAALQDNADLLAKAWERVQLQFGAAVASSPELQRAIEDVTAAIVSMATSIGQAAPEIAKFFDGAVMAARGALALIQGFASGDSLAELKAAGQEIALDAEDAAERQRIIAERLAFEQKHLVQEGVRFHGEGEDKKLKDAEAAAAKRQELFEKVVLAEKAKIFGWHEEQLKGSLALLDNLVKVWNDGAEEYAKSTEAEEDARIKAEDAKGAAIARTRKEQAEAAAEMIADLRDLANITMDFGDLLGGAFGKFLGLAGEVTHGILNIKAGIESIKGGGLLDKLVGGLGVAGSVISIGKSVFDSLFGGAKKAQEEIRKAREEMERLRSEFVKSHGGMDALARKAREAGISLTAMFAAKTAEQLQSAISGIKDGLETWGQAQQDIADAMDRYGLTVDQMGPRFAQQQLDQQAAQLIKDFALLTQAGADVVTVTGAMADELNAYVNSALKSGATIPESMRKIIDALFAEGKLLHENGEAYTQAEKDGLNYTQTMSEQFAGLMQQIQKLVEALARGFNVPVNFHYTSSGESSNPAGNSHQPPKNLPEGAGGFIGTFPPTGGMAMLHNREAVVPLSDPGAMAALGAAIASAISASGGGGSQRPIIVRNELAGRPLDSYISNRMRQRGIRSPQQQRGGRTF